MPVAHHTGPPVGKALIGHRGKKCLGVRLHGLSQKPARAFAQYRCQRIIERVGMRKGNNSAICLHGVSLSRPGGGDMIFPSNRVRIMVATKGDGRLAH